MKKKSTFVAKAVNSAQALLFMQDTAGDPVLAGKEWAGLMRLDTVYIYPKACNMLVLIK